MEAIQALQPGNGGGRKQARTPPGKRAKRMGRASRVGFVAGIALMAIGFGAMCFKAAAPAAPEAVEVAGEGEGVQAAPRLSPAEVERLDAEARVAWSKIPRAETARWVDQPRDDAKERARLLRSLEVEGKGPRFFPPCDLKLPADGKPVTLYCLLHVPLDPASEETWAKAGMFREEHDIVSPYLRTVVIDSADTRRHLDHGFVDRLACSISVPFD